MRFKIDLASLIVGRKFTVFALFTLYLRAISKCKPPWEGGGVYLEGLFNGGFLRFEFGGLIFGILWYIHHWSGDLPFGR